MRIIGKEDIHLIKMDFSKEKPLYFDFYYYREGIIIMIYTKVDGGIRVRWVDQDQEETCIRSQIYLDPVDIDEVRATHGELLKDPSFQMFGNFGNTESIVFPDGCSEEMIKSIIKNRDLLNLNSVLFK